MSGPWIAAFLALAVMSLATLVVVLGVLRRTVPVLEVAAARLPGSPPAGPAPGTPLPPFDGIALDGGTPSSGDPLVLLFVDEGCEPCATLLGELRQAGVRLTTARLYLVVEDGTDQAALPTGPGIHALRQERGAVARALGVDTLPSAAAVAGGIILDWQPVGSVERLHRLVDKAEATAAALAVGSST